MKRLLITLLMLTGAALACTGTLTGITGVPLFVCPTPIYNTPVPLPTFVPIPGYPTLIPLPTAPPPPTVTPYMIQPPQPFYRGDAIMVTRPAARLRLVQVDTVQLSTYSVAVWQIAITNLSASPLELFPAYQSYVNRVSGTGDGLWGASMNAAVAAGLSVVYEAVGLAPNTTQTFTLAGYIPYGSQPEQITFMLDPNTRSTPQVPGSNPLVWTVALNPLC